MVVSKIVDVLIVESLRREVGFDAYKDGANIALNNLHFRCMPAFCGQNWTDTLLHRFVEMFRDRTPKSVQWFYGAARALYEMSINRDYAALLLSISGDLLTRGSCIPGSSGAWQSGGRSRGTPGRDGAARRT